MVLGQRQQQQQQQHLALSFSHFCSSRLPVSVVVVVFVDVCVCMHLYANCLRGIIFCVSIGLSSYFSYLQCSFHAPFINLRMKENTERESAAEEIKKNYTGWQFKGHWFRTEK